MRNVATFFLQDLRLAEEEADNLRQDLDAMEAELEQERNAKTGNGDGGGRGRRGKPDQHTARTVQNMSQPISPA